MIVRYRNPLYEQPQALVQNVQILALVVGILIWRVPLLAFCFQTPPIEQNLCLFRYQGGMTLWYLFDSLLLHRYRWDADRQPVELRCIFSSHER